MDTFKIAEAALKWPLNLAKYRNLNYFMSHRRSFLKKLAVHRQINIRSLIKTEWKEKVK